MCEKAGTKLRYCVKHFGKEQRVVTRFVTHDRKGFSFIVVHTIHLLIVPVHQLINGTSRHQHNSINADINLSHYSTATCFNHIMVIL
jgi:hypothetical protein